MRRVPGGVAKSFANTVLFLLYMIVFAVTSTIADGKTAYSSASQSVKLPEGEQLAHKIVSGAIGPWKTAQVLLTQSKEVLDGPFSGKVVANPGEKDEVTYDLQPPYDAQAPFLITVRAVMFRSIDRSTQKALIILYSVTKIGPQQPTEYESAVYKWNGEAFARVDTLEAKLAGARTSREIDKKLNKR